MSSNAAVADALRWRKFPVLDDGFVCLVDVMGDDGSVVQAARVSYGAGTRPVSDDRTLIRYLMRHEHSTPFEMAEVKLLVRVPMDCWRQWIRHRTASVNELSTRYSIAIDSAQKTPPDRWRRQARGSRQGSEGALDPALGAELSASEAELQSYARRIYERRLDLGVAREQARKDLPLSTYTEAYWKIDLHNLLHFLHLRMDLHAQQEIRAYATVIGEQIVARWVPIAWEAFLDYRRSALTLSGSETEIVAAIGAGDRAKATELAAAAGWLERTEEGALKASRERRELEEKLLRLGMTAPWKERAVR